MAHLEEGRDRSAREHELIATTIASALDCVYLPQNIVTDERDSALVASLTMGPISRQTKYLLPTLPHSLGLCLENEDISLICLANMTIRTFWDYVVEKLGLDSSTRLPTSGSSALTIQIKKIDMLRQLALSASSNAEIKIDYCPKPEDFSLHTGFQIRSSAVNGNSSLAKVFDQQVLNQELSAKLCTTIEDGTREQWVRSFYLGYLQLHQWAFSRGILSSELGMLDLECLSTIYLTYVCQDLTGVNSTLDILPKSLFSYLQGTFDSRVTQDNVEVLTPSGRDLTAHIQSENLRAICGEVERAMGLYTATTETHLSFSVDDGLHDFASMYKLYVKLSVRCWNVKHRPDFYASIPQVLLALQAKCRRSSRGSQSARIWPHPLIIASEDDGSNKHFLLGIASDDDEDIFLPRESLDNTLSDFIASLGYDHASALITHDIFTSSGLLALLPSLSHQQPSQDPVSAPPLSLPGTPPTKFRTAAATLNRLMWDPQHAAIEYEVGYVDRFEDDLVWKPLESWERHTENEDFVPEHRIWRIRRKDNGELVWDREERWDGTGEGR